MFTMDSKSKGISWVDNIYQTFESMYLEVEDIICQEAPKFVESQVQQVGESAKKFYAGVLEDLLPPTYLDPVGRGASELSCEQDSNDVIAKRSDIAIEEDPMNDKSSDDKSKSLGKHLSSTFFSSETCDLDHLPDQSMNPDLVEGGGSDLSCEQITNNWTCKRFDKAVEEDRRNDKASDDKSKSPLEKDLSKALLSTEADDIDNLPHPTMNPDTVSLGMPLEDDNVPIVEVFSAAAKDGNSEDKEGVTSLSDVTTPLGNQPLVFSSLNNKVHLDSIFPEDPGANFNLSVKQSCGLVMSKLLITDSQEAHASSPCKALNFSNGMNASSRASLPGRFSSEVHEKANDERSHDIVAMVSSELALPVACCQNMDLGAITSRCSLQADFNVRSDDDHAQSAEYHDCVETCMQDIEHFDQVDLGESCACIKDIGHFDKVDLGGSCIVVDNAELFSSFPRPCNHRSFKKKIRDAFASRLRTKQREYEQLAIWYGDFAVENLKRAGSSTSLSGSRTLSTDDPYESDWEIL